ncbi:hypothetical protein TELCIR_11671 [Teladorsagia circumcincta]|uniref:Uncharacterized protein n=1 Tax=Teladorsagia circumcincta TaxID=45464 RepID=A0A2G9U8U0_TELCI|nr:hypothetical protein TELCIR_11671 [Teladorsagia circumcincta]
MIRCWPGIKSPNAPLERYGVPFAGKSASFRSLGDMANGSEIVRVVIVPLIPIVLIVLLLLWEKFRPREDNCGSTNNLYTQLDL